MHQSLLKILHSPFTKQAFDLEIFEEGSIGDGPRQIISGKLSTLTEEYPIINGVPRILPRELLLNAIKRYPDFQKQYHARFSHLFGQSEQQNSADQLKVETQDSFGFQWNTFSEMYPVWKENFIGYISPYLSLNDFNGKMVLDCGCGFGRHLHYVAEAGAQMAVGLDLSHAVDSTIVNLAKFSNVHLIQGDIYNPPFDPIFDIAYCIGVLQHLPDPAAGFLSITKMINQRGKVFAWIYGQRPSSYHLVVDNLRKVTVKMKPQALYYFSYLLALLSFTFLAIPRRLLVSVGADRLGSRIPFSQYAKYPFRVSHADWFDRLAAPKTAYLLEEEIWSMVNNTNFQVKNVSTRPDGGWRVFGGY